VESAVWVHRHGFKLLSRGEAVIVVPPAALGGWNAQQFWELLSLACSFFQRVVVNLSQTSLGDSQAAAPLLMALRYADDYDVDLRLVLDPMSSFHASLADGLLWRLIPVFDSLAEALATALSAGPPRDKQWPSRSRRPSPPGRAPGSWRTG
jgi:hypothetical protein